MYYIHETANDKNEGLLIRNPRLIVKDDFIGLFGFDELDYIMYKRYGWDWEETNGQIELMNNMNGETVTVTTKDVSYLMKGKLEEFNVNLYNTFFNWIEEYKKQKETG